MLATVIKQTDREEVPDTGRLTGMDVLQRETHEKEVNVRQQAIKRKIQFICKMAKMQRTLREQRESILAIKALNDNKLPQGLLLEGAEAIERFRHIREKDILNESHPFSLDLDSTGHMSTFDMGDKDYSNYFKD